MMRVYLPSTLPMLRDMVSRDTVWAEGGLAFAVTPDFRAEYPEADEDELEYLAMSDAARASLRLITAVPDTDPLRVVLAVDVETYTAAADLDRSVVRLTGDLGWKQVASVHLDGADASEVVAAAAAVVDAADLGDIDAEFAVGEAGDIDLAWYAPSEIRFLLDDLA